MVHFRTYLAAWINEASRGFLFGSSFPLIHRFGRNEGIESSHVQFREESLHNTSAKISEEIQSCNPVAIAIRLTDLNSTKDQAHITLSHSVGSEALLHAILQYGLHISCTPPRLSFGVARECTE